MNKSVIGLAVLAATLVFATGPQAHHAVASVYDLNTEVVLEGQLKDLNLRNPHSNIHVTVPNDDGTSTEWVLTTPSLQMLTRAGVSRSSIQVGENLRVTILPARNGNPSGFIRRLELSDRVFELDID